MSLSKSNSMSAPVIADATKDISLVPKVTVVQIQKVLAEYLNLVSATSYLNAQEKSFLQALNLPDQSTLLNGLAEIINEVMQQGVVHSHDIPQLVLSASNLIHAKIKELALVEVRPLNILKFILTSLLQNNLIPVSTQQIQKAQAVLDNCFTMLEIVLPSAKSQKSCLGALFPCLSK